MTQKARIFCHRNSELDPLDLYTDKTTHSKHLSKHFPVATMAKQKVCLAYSGGLDTSCILQYLLVRSSRVLKLER